MSTYSRNQRISFATKLQSSRALPPILCHYCNKNRATTNDHIIPRSLGGPNAKWNRVPACGSCNKGKADKLPTCECRKCRQAVALFNNY